MTDKILWNYIFMDILFLVSGILLLVYGLVVQNKDHATLTTSNVATHLLLELTPLTAAIANAVLVFVTFLMSVPAMIMPTTRGWLKMHGFLVVVCGLFSMIVGLDIWFKTLKMRHNLEVVWDAQPQAAQSLLQERFICCGYRNSTSPHFAPDNICPTDAVAATLQGCITPFVSFANNFLDVIFTAAFGIVGVDAGLVIATAILLKDRKEKIRYRHIDEKNGTRSI